MTWTRQFFRESIPETLRKLRPIAQCDCLITTTLMYALRWL